MACRAGRLRVGSTFLKSAVDSLINNHCPLSP